ncbi:MAG TPA: HlyD family efflux transporter periplasmic adaptor subunit, partial [Longimicrobium sp.]|nr:HlyD family efflux transporter periplasmic adaptor subunit [Longimicrobium sp.]
LVLAAAERDRSRELARRNLLSTAEADAVEQQYLQKRFAVEQGTNSTVNNQIQIAAQRTALLDLQGSRGEERRRLELAVRAAHASLRAALAGWEQSYLLRAPVAGRVAFFTPLTESQFVSASEPVMAVVPDSGKVLARVRVGPEGAGRVAAGHRVHLAFDSYPRSEYGLVEGRVRRVSLVGFREKGAERTEHLVEVEMPHGLRTSYGQQIPFRQEMEAQAEIVTEDLRLIERIFNQFRGLAGRR